MYVGVRHAASASEVVDAEFQCRHCGVKKFARIRAIGTGSVQSPYFIGMSRARDKAAESAVSDAMESGRIALQRARCPACGKSQHGGNMAFEFARLALLGGASCAALGWAWFGPPASLICGAVGALSGAAAAYAKRRAISQVSANIEFSDGEPLDRPVIGKKCVLCTKGIVTAADGIRCAVCGSALHQKACHEQHVAAKHPQSESQTSA
jgi:DNA-directed RNA polymerase subunit RPC12/RpoP